MCFHSLAVVGKSQCHLFARTHARWTPACHWEDGLVKLAVKSRVESAVQNYHLKKKYKGKKIDQAAFPRELCWLAGTFLMALQMLWVVCRQLPLNAANGRTAAIHHLSTAPRLVNSWCPSCQRGNPGLPCHLLAVITHGTEFNTLQQPTADFIPFQVKGLS